MVSSMTAAPAYTGTCLRFEEKHYHCNSENIVSCIAESDGMPRFRPLCICTYIKDSSVCKHYHPDEGWVEMLHIR